MGRIGARAPFYGSAHGVVPPEVAVVWLDAILALDWKKIEPAAFAAVQIARMTGDRSRDLPDAARAAVVRRLEAMGAAQAWIAMVRETVELDRADEGRVFGESLPVGAEADRLSIGKRGASALEMLRPQKFFRRCVAREARLLLNTG